MSKSALYPGSFDPVTKGHFDLIERSLSIFDNLIVGVAVNPSKSPLFSVSERLEMLETVTAGLDAVRVCSFECLVVEFAKEVGSLAIIRGLRAISDFETELQMALVNRKLEDSLESVFMVPNERYWYLSSKIVKEVALFGGDISDFVHPYVKERLYQKNRKMKK